MKDTFSRGICYMRIAITDRCNLKCIYCRPEEIPFIPHDDILRYEEILRVCGIGANLGVTAIRVTGGEPLMRKGCGDFIRALKQIPGIERVSLTTNGVFLQSHLDALEEAKLDGLNVSLDTLNPGRYRELTGLDAFETVWGAVLESVDRGIAVKLNFVPMEGVNREEIIPFANLARKLPVDVRFIELMPSGENRGLTGVPAGEVFSILKEEYGDLEEDHAQRGFGPARYFKSRDMQGSIGLISALSDNFCATCNRLRLTSEGFLKVCLHHNLGIDLRDMLRSGAADEAIAAAIEKGVLLKPKQHVLQEGTNLHFMSRIGG